MFNNANVGPVDSIIRLIVGLALIVLPYVTTHELWANQYVLYGMTAVGVILVLTALARFCPLYRLIGVSTCKAT